MRPALIDVLKLVSEADLTFEQIKITCKFYDAPACGDALSNLQDVDMISYNGSKYHLLPDGKRKLNELTAEPNTTVCPKCRTNLPDTATFCPQCGTPRSGLVKPVQASPQRVAQPLAKPLVASTPRRAPTEEEKRDAFLFGDPVNA